MKAPVLALAAATILAGARPQRPDLARLRGDWVLELRPQSNVHSAAHRGMATLSLDVVTAPHQPKVVQGTYSLSIQGLTRPDPCMMLAGTVRLVPLARDSVHIDLHQGFTCGLRIVGVVRGDSVVGRWTQLSSSGPVARGRFSLTRRR